MEKFSKFEDIFEFLESSFITKYAEYDDTNRCYFSVEDCIPFVNKGPTGGGYSINLRDGKTGQLVHLLKKENDFYYGTVENLFPNYKLTVHNKSGYTYVVYFKKI